MAELLVGTLLVLSPADAAVLVRLVERERAQRRADGFALRHHEVDLFAKVERAAGRGDPLQWVRAADAARLLGVTPQAVASRIKAGTLPVRREGRAVYVGLSRSVKAA